MISIKGDKMMEVFHTPKMCGHLCKQLNTKHTVKAPSGCTFLVSRVSLIHSLWQGLHHPTVEKYLTLPVPVGAVLGGTGKSLLLFPLLCPAKAVPPSDLPPPSHPRKNNRLPWPTRLFT